MHKPLSIPHPNLKAAVKLSALQLNDIKIEDKHTVLTPKLLKQMASQK